MNMPFDPRIFGYTTDEILGRNKKSMYMNKYEKKIYDKGFDEGRSCTINITEGINDYEFYNVPEKVAKAIITLLHECEKDDSTIVSAISER